MGYFAAVKLVLKNQIKCSTGELLTAIFGAVGPRSALALDPGVGKVVPQRVNRLEREIAPVDLDNNAGLGGVDDQRAEVEFERAMTRNSSSIEAVQGSASPSAPS